jgi:hypothetical protein
MSTEFGNPLIQAPQRSAEPLAVETNLSDFLRRGIHSLLPGRPAMVSAVSYRGIAGYEPGELTQRNAPVRVHAFPGDHRVNLSYALGAHLHRASGLRLGQAIVREILEREMARANSEAVSSMLAAEMLLREAKESPLVIVYAGFHGFGGCVESARRLALARADAQVTFVTCTCCLEAKRAQLEPLVATGALRALVVVSSCGAENEMGEIVSTLLRLS